MALTKAELWSALTIDPPKLTFSSGDGAYKADRFGLTLDGVNFSIMLFSDAVDSVVLSGDDTLIKSGSSVLSVGSDDIDLILVFDGVSNYSTVACSRSKTATVVAQLESAGQDVIETIQSAWKFNGTGIDYDWRLPNSAWCIYPRAIGEEASDSGDGLTFDLAHNPAMHYPVPVVYVDGVQQAGGYTFDYGDSDTAASVTFSASKSGSVVLVDYSWRWQLSGDEFGDEFKLQDELNIRSSKDINGKRAIDVAYNVKAGWRGGLHFPYLTTANFNSWFEVIDNAYPFDLERPNLTAPFDLIENLIAVTYPEFSEIPSVAGGGRSHLAFAVEEIT